MRLRYSVLILSLLIMGSGLVTAWTVQNNFGGVITSDINLVTDDGVVIHGTLQVPLGVTAANPVPGIVAIHGFASTNEMLRGFSIELARRGCVVLSIDATGHGNSDPKSGSSSDRGGYVAVEYLDSLPYVNRIGMIGHSMGAGISLGTVMYSNVTIDAAVLVAGGVSSPGTYLNVTFPKNVLVAVGAFDELFSIPSLLDNLSETFNTTSPVQEGQLYGDFSAGTARKVIISPSNHLTELIDPYIISETVGWFEESFTDTLQGDWIPKEQLIYPYFSLGGLLSLLGLFLSVFPLYVIFLEAKPLKRFKKHQPSEELISRKEYAILGTLYGVLGLVTFPVFVAIGVTLPLPLIFSGGFGVWLLGSGIVTLFVLIAVVRKKKWQTKVWDSFGVDSRDLRNTTLTYGYHVLLALAVIAWLVLWVYVSDLLLVVDFRVFVPVLKTITPLRALMLPLLLVFTIPFFTIEGMWITGILRPKLTGNNVTSLIKWGVKIALTKLLPYLILFAAQYLPTLIFGDILIQGYLGFLLLFLFTSIFLFGITTIFTAWSVHLTGKVYSGAIISAFLLSWSLASILPFGF